MSDNSNLIKRLRDYSNARKGEIAELTREAADALERQKGTLEEEYMKHYIQGRKDERAIQEGRMMQTFSPDNGMTESRPLAPAADVVERKRGEWIPLFWVNNLPYCYECSVCGSLTGSMRNFCYNCGSDMRGET